jgi:hypothetical protein
MGVMTDLVVALEHILKMAKAANESHQELFVWMCP